MNSLEPLITAASEIEEKLGYHFVSKELLALAFIHRSYVNENKQSISTHNERLEFLGDSVLGMLVAAYLYQNMPEKPEGELSYLRSRLVEASSCVVYIHKLNVEKHLFLGRGESLNNGRGRESILADLFEALIGAIYLDGGIAAASHFLFNKFSEEMQAILKEPMRNWKAELQDSSQKKRQQTPIYKVISATGPDHSKLFQVSVWINEKEIGIGFGSSKKEAQQAAASDALINMRSAF